ncbi:alpha/beta hydrolase [Solicola sp. PLA-1-18]|uniref:alpha/beta hydrolase n=1 Tax=Solicola sp. PLA-1-18 TaxID=3380532 RepID=UPI003B791896
MPGHFDLYPSSVDELVGVAAQLRAAGEQFDGSAAELAEAGERATQEVAGDLVGPVAQVPAPAAGDAESLRDASVFAAGAMLSFAEAVDAFDRTVAGLNREYDALPQPPSPESVAALRRRYEEAEAEVDRAGSDTAGMLGRGPNVADLAILGSRGLLPSASDYDDPALASAFDKTGKNFPNAAFPVDDLSPEEVAVWWDSLTLVERLAVMRSRSARLGNTDGLPAEVRDEANRLALGQDLEDLEQAEAEGRLTESQQQRLVNARQIAEQLAQAEGHVDPVTGEPTGAQLYVYDPSDYDGEGRAAIVTGNADTADDVAWNVPGTDSDVENMSVSRSNAIYDAARDDNLGSRSTAVVTWMGYDAPEWNTSVATEGRAEDGAQRLADDVAGLAASRGDDQPHTTVIGHSYGSTTVARAGAEEGLGDHADEIVLVGSPGASSADHASDLGVGEDHVFVGANSSDPVTYLGGTGWVHGITSTLGNDPAEDDFGAVRFQAEAPDRASWVGFGDHSKYFDPGSESLYNIAQVVNGDHGDVTTAEHRYDPWYDEMQDPERDREPGVAPR